jgi:hypothetical protein
LDLDEVFGIQKLNGINECQSVAMHGLVPQDKWPDTLMIRTAPRTRIFSDEWLALQRTVGRV